MWSWPNSGLPPETGPQILSALIRFHTTPRSFHRAAGEERGFGCDMPNTGQQIGLPPVTPPAGGVLSLHPGEGHSTISSVIDETRLRQLLEPFGLTLSSAQAHQILAYLHLLLRWNQKINLTAIRDPEESVTRHFGESLFLARHVQLYGDLLDIGSGAGFPGLALKIAAPRISVTLLEPVAKKRAFLKEAARVCGFRQVEVRGERLEDLVRATPAPAFDFATMRAVGNLEVLAPLAARCLKPNGSLCLWLTQDQTAGLGSIECGLTWSEPLPVPLSRASEIWLGLKPGGLYSLCPHADGGALA